MGNVLGKCTESLGMDYIIEKVEGRYRGTEKTQEDGEIHGRDGEIHGRDREIHGRDGGSLQKAKKKKKKIGRESRL